MFIKKREYEKLVREKEAAEYLLSCYKNDKSFEKEIQKNVETILNVYSGKLSEDELEKLAGCTVNETINDKWICYHRKCYYGGCEFDEHVFESKKDALKDSAMISLLETLNEKLRKKIDPNSKPYCYVNSKCKDYQKCSDI